MKQSSFILHSRNSLQSNRLNIAITIKTQYEKKRRGTCDGERCYYNSLRTEWIDERRIGRALLCRSGWHAYDCCHATFDNVAMVIIITAEREAESRSVTMAQAVCVLQSILHSVLRSVLHTFSWHLAHHLCCLVLPLMQHANHLQWHRDHTSER